MGDCWNEENRRREEVKTRLAICGFIRKSSTLFKSYKKEVETSETFLNEQESQVLKQYYHSTMKSKDYFKFSQHVYAERVKYLVRITKTGKAKKVLDAGCGLGSEVILCGILGADATGIDIKEERLHVAKKRVKYYENTLNTKILEITGVL